MCNTLYQRPIEPLQPNCNIYPIINQATGCLQTETCMEMPIGSCVSWWDTVDLDSKIKLSVLVQVLSLLAKIFSPKCSLPTEPLFEVLPVFITIAAETDPGVCTRERWEDLEKLNVCCLMQQKIFFTTHTISYDHIVLVMLMYFQ